MRRSIESEGFKVKVTQHGCHGIYHGGIIAHEGFITEGGESLGDGVHVVGKGCVCVLRYGEEEYIERMYVSVYVGIQLL